MSAGSYEGEIGRHPAYIWTMLPLCVLAVLLNLLVIGGVWRYGRFKTSVDIFLVNLAVSEIWQSAVVFPIYLRNIVKAPDEDFYGGQVVCKITMFLPLMIVMSAILSMVVMAIDRYRCILQQKTMSRSTALGLVGLVWLLSFITSSPQIYEYNIYEKRVPALNITIKSCGSEHIPENFEEIYASIVFVICYGLPLIVLTACYGKILRFVWKNANKFLRWSRGRQVGPDVRTQTDQSQSGTTVRNITTRKVKVVKMLVNITASFTVLWTPYFILFALTEVMHLDDSAYQMQWPHVIGRTLTAVSTLVNPVIFIHFSDQLRSRLAALITCATCSTCSTCASYSMRGGESSSNRVLQINTTTAVTVTKRARPPTTSDRTPNTSDRLPTISDRLPADSPTIEMKVTLNRITSDKPHTKM